MGKFYGLLGEKLGHSISPQIHKLVFEELNQARNLSIISGEKRKT